jgi:hypothetical protein
LLFPTLLPFLRLLDLLLPLLLPTLLPFGAVLLLFLPALLPALLLLRLLLLPSRVTFLPALLATGLVLLPPLLATASSALSACEVTRAQQRGGYRKGKPDSFDVLHFLSFLSVLTGGERSTRTLRQLSFHHQNARKSAGSV